MVPDQLSLKYRQDIGNLIRNIEKKAEKENQAQNMNHLSTPTL